MLVAHFSIVLLAIKLAKPKRDLCRARDLCSTFLSRKPLDIFITSGHIILVVKAQPTFMSEHFTALLVRKNVVFLTRQQDIYQPRLWQ